MNSFSMRHLSIICLLAFVLAFTAGCQDDPVKVVPDPGPEWPDLTSEEDVIDTIRLVYEYFNRVSENELMSHYGAILYDDPNQVFDYVWNMQPADVALYGDVLLREEDIAGTWYVLDNSSALALDISPGSWNTATDVCDECLQTIRTYSITLTLEHNGQLFSLSGNEMRINFVIGPNEQVPGTWAIYIASDLPSL